MYFVQCYEICMGFFIVTKTTAFPVSSTLETLDHLSAAIKNTEELLSSHLLFSPLLPRKELFMT